MTVWCHAETQFVCRPAFAQYCRVTQHWPRLECSLGRSVHGNRLEFPMLADSCQHSAGTNRGKPEQPIYSWTQQGCWVHSNFLGGVPWRLGFPRANATDVQNDQDIVVPSKVLYTINDSIGLQQIKCCDWVTRDCQNVVKLAVHALSREETRRRQSSACVTICEQISLRMISSSPGKNSKRTPVSWG